MSVLLVVCGLILQAARSVPQTPEGTSPTWDETINRLGPTFLSSANATTTSTCNGEPATTDSEKATITRYTYTTTAVAELYVRQISQTGAWSRRQGMLLNPAIDQTWHLTLNTLSPNIRITTYDRPGGGPCHYDNQPWYTLIIVTTDGDTIVSDKGEAQSVLDINFFDESMAKRCAAALSHLITLAGGKPRKPPPF